MSKDWRDRRLINEGTSSTESSHLGITTFGKPMRPKSSIETMYIDTKGMIVLKTSRNSTFYFILFSEANNYLLAAKRIFHYPVSPTEISPKRNKSPYRVAPSKNYAELARKSQSHFMDIQQYKEQHMMQSKRPLTALQRYGKKDI
jgi:hypothetical protein